MKTFIKNRHLKLFPIRLLWFIGHVVQLKLECPGSIPGVSTCCLCSSRFFDLLKALKNQAFTLSLHVSNQVWQWLNCLRDWDKIGRGIQMDVSYYFSSHKKKT